MCCRCSSAEERLKPRPSPPSTFYVLDGLTEGRLSAHNGEVTGSKPVAGKTKLFSHFLIFSFSHFLIFSIKILLIFLIKFSSIIKHLFSPHLFIFFEYLLPFHFHSLSVFYLLVFYEYYRPTH